MDLPSTLGAVESQGHSNPGNNFDSSLQEKRQVLKECISAAEQFCSCDST